MVVEVKEGQVVVVVEGEMRDSISLRYAVSRQMRRIFRRNVDLRVRVVRR